jgi:hypothetical protein
MEIPNPAVRQRAVVKRGIAADADPLQPVQARAQATRDALLAAGRAMLADCDFDSLSIADLAAASKLSVGSFYGRFRDKEAFFEQLQEQVTAEFLLAARQALLAKEGSTTPPEAIVAKVCAMVIDGFRKDAGYVRAALRHASTQPASWSPIQSAGRQVVQEVIAVLGPKLTHIAPTQRGARIRFAMQLLYGTGINALLNDPGPIPLRSKRLERELSRVLCLYLGIPKGTDLGPRPLLSNTKPPLSTPRRSAAQRPRRPA